MIHLHILFDSLILCVINQSMKYDLHVPFVKHSEERIPLLKLSPTLVLRPEIVNYYYILFYNL